MLQNLYLPKYSTDKLGIRLANALTENSVVVENHKRSIVYSLITVCGKGDAPVTQLWIFSLKSIGSDALLVSNVMVRKCL